MNIETTRSVILSLKSEIEQLLDTNDNKIYCDSITSFINMSVRELLDSIKKNDNKIRLGLR
jgi:hypothetical protein